MSITQFSSVISAAQASAVITLDAGTGGTITRTDGVAPYNTTVGIRFNTNGTVETGTAINGDAITWSSAGNWIDPTSEASIDYDVRFTNFSGAGGGDWTTEATTDDNWIELDTLRLYLMNSTVEETISFTCDFEVRDGGGAPPTTAVVGYTFQIQNLP